MGAMFYGVIMSVSGAQVDLILQQDLDAAGVLRDKMLRAMTHGDLDFVFAPKARRKIQDYCAEGAENFLRLLIRRRNYIQKSVHGAMSMPIISTLQQLIKHDAPHHRE